MKVRQFFRKDQYFFGVLGAVVDIFFAALSVKYFNLNGFYVIVILAIPTVFLLLLVSMRTAEEERPHPSIHLPAISNVNVNIGRPKIKIGEDQHNCPVHGFEFCANAKSKEHVCMQSGGVWTES